MLRKPLIALIGIITVAALPLAVSGQSSTCDLKMSIFSLDKERNITDVSDADARLKKVITDEIKTSPGFITTNPQFINITSGKYKLEVKKKGFAVRNKEIEVDCGLADETNAIKEHVFLWPPGLKPPKTKATAFTVSKENSKTEPPSDSVNGKAIIFVSPKYPAAARAVRAFGQIIVTITIDEDGNVVNAIASDGHPLLQSVSIRAAKLSKFSPTLLEGYPVKVTGDIVYNFKPF